MTEIGKRIKYLRKTKDMSQKDLANQLHVVVSTISNWETGRNNVSLEFFAEIAKALKVSVSDLVNEEETVKANHLPIAMSSKPYLDYEYSFNYVYWIVLLIAVVLTFISPIFKGVIEDLSILSWLIFVLLSIGLLIKNYKKNISTKYFEDGQTLYYEHKQYTEDDIEEKKSIRGTLMFLMLMVNVVLVMSAAIIFTYTDDLFTYILYPTLFIMMNLLLVYSFIIQTNELRKGKTMSYNSINLNFFLARIKVMLMLYIIVYVYHYLVLHTQELYLYNDFAIIVFHFFFSIGIFVFVWLYEQEKFYYSLFRIKVK